MRLPATPLVTALALLFTPAARAEAMDPLQLIPNAADAVVKVENPRLLFDTIYGHEALQAFLKMDAVAAFYDTTKFRRLTQLLAYFQKELGQEPVELLDRLSGGGAVLAARFEQQEVLIVVKAKDEELLKSFVTLTRKIIEEELARQELKERPRSRRYRNIETIQFGKDVHFALAGPFFIFANRQAALKKALDLYKDGGASMGTDETVLSETKSLLPEQCLVWGRVNLERVKNIKNVKNVLNTLELDLASKFVNGGVVDVIKRSPYLCAGLAAQGQNLSLRIALPRGREGMSPVGLMILPQGDPATLPLLVPPRTLSSTSYFIDLKQFWDNKDKILLPAQAKSLANFEAQTAKYLKSIGLGSILQQAGKYQRIVVASPGTSPYKTKPKVQTGCFAIVLDMRDPAFAKSMGTVLRGAAFLGTLKFGWKMVEEKHKGQTLVGYLFSEERKLDGDDNDIRFNFSPCFTGVGNQFVIASTIELGKDIIDCLANESKSATSEATQRTYVYGRGVAASLRPSEDLLVSQAILSRALPALAAKQQYQELVRLVESLGEIHLETRYGANDFRFDIVWQFSKN